MLFLRRYVALLEEPELDNCESNTGRNDRSRNEQSDCEELSEESNASDCGQQRHEELRDGGLGGGGGAKRVVPSGFQFRGKAVMSPGVSVRAREGCHVH